MHLIAMPALALILSSAATVVASTAASSFLPKEYYLSDIAPIQLQRLSEYTDQHNDTLTTAQVAFFSKAATAVATFDTPMMDSLRYEAEALFTADDARFILTGKGVTRKARRGENNLQAAQGSCTCSSADSWCDNNTACKAGQGGCGKVGGCGSFWSRQCDGLCVNP